MIGISILSVIILLGVLIFAHELGHFLMAKRAGVGVLKFSLGFGPRLVGRKIGETEYLLSMIPLGGYVKLLGEAPGEELSEEEQRRSFQKQTVWKRIAIVGAGPLFNVLLALLIFTGVNMVGLPVMVAEIGSTQPGSVASEAGFRPGDLITEIGGKRVGKWDDVSGLISASGGNPISITVRRDGTAQRLTVTPKASKARTIFGEEVESYRIGISPSSRTEVVRMNPLAAFAEGVRQTWLISRLTVVSIVKMIEGVVSPRTMGGPILIAQIAGAQVKEGIVPFLLFMALLSINLAILNLLPIPVLDGGHLLFYTIEAVTGREVSPRWREIAQQAGFAILILLMAFVFLMDIERLNIKFINDFLRMFTGAP